MLDGRLHATVGDQTRDYRAGESFTIPAGTFHSAQNVEAQPARMHFRTVRRRRQSRLR